MFKLLMASVAGCLLAGSAQASITFTLNDVTFSDWTRASGYFVTDDAATSISDFRIRTEEGVLFQSDDMGDGGIQVSDFSYNRETANADIFSMDGLTSAYFVVPDAYDQGRGLELRFGTPSSAGEKSVRGSESQFVFNREIQSGTISASQGVIAPTNPGDGGPIVGAVPEPATWALMIGGFGLVGGTMRRRKAATTRVAFA